MVAPGGGCEGDTMKANSLRVIPSRADGEGPPSRTKNQHDRFRDVRSRRVEHVQRGLSNSRTVRGPSPSTRLGMTAMLLAA